MMQTLALDALSSYVRRSPFELGKWRLARTSINWTRDIGPRMGERTIVTKHGFRMRLRLEDWVDQHIYATGEFDADVGRVARAILKPGDCAIDVGANIGYFSLLFAALTGTNGTVLAFEPQPSVYERLLENIRLNPGLKVLARREALNDSNGALPFYCGSPEHTGIASFRQQPGRGSVVVEARRLDDLFDADRPVQLIKIDIEGAESLAVDGMQRTLTRWHPDLCVEVSDRFLREMGSSAKVLCERFWSLGYTMYQLSWDGIRCVTRWSDDISEQFNALFTTRTQLPKGLADSP